MKLGALACVLLLLGSMRVSAQEGSALAEENWFAALRHGEWHFVPRYRFENVDDTAQSDPARASTLRSRFNYRVPAWRGWSGFLEVDDVRAVGPDLYNSTRNGVTNRPSVLDPEGTELNQASFGYADERYNFTVGRQRLVLDDQRFIGAGSWRQNEQTVDAATARVRLPRAELFYGYVANVNRSVGPSAGTPPGDLRSQSHLLNARFTAGPLGSIATFAYLFDFDNAPALSARNLGVLWSGTVPLAEQFGLLHVLSYVQQQDAGDNPSDFRAHYGQVQLGLRYRSWSLLAGQERLSGDAVRIDASFQTPLAASHLVQGWADKFAAATPPQGIRDSYASLAGSWRGVGLQVSHHWYAAQAVSRDYGREWNASLSYRFATRYDVLAKVADYTSAGFSTDATKLWLQLSANF